jgi:hypothetical protein
MTIHVSVRWISALLSVNLLGARAGAPAPSVVAPQKTAPTLAERLDRLAAAFDRNRIDFRVLGAVSAVVRGEEVIYQVERVEVGVKFAPDTFTRQPTTVRNEEGRAVLDGERDVYAEPGPHGCHRLHERACQRAQAL